MQIKMITEVKFNLFQRGSTTALKQNCSTSKYKIMKKYVSLTVASDTQ